MGSAYFAILAIKRGNPGYWLWFGVIAGLGLEEKYTIALFGFGIVAGLLFTQQRRAFASKWLWLGGIAAFLVFLANVLWDIPYPWPFLCLIGTRIITFRRSTPCCCRPPQSSPTLRSTVLLESG